MLSVIFHWIIFEKCGQKGWYSIIPIFDTYALFSMGWDTSYFWMYMVCMGSMVGAACASVPMGMILAYALGMLLYLVMLIKLLIKMPKGKIWVVLSIISDVILGCLNFAVSISEMYASGAFTRAI